MADGAVRAVLAAPPTASAQQSLNFYVGGFVPRGEDARGDATMCWSTTSISWSSTSRTSTAPRSAASGWSASAIASKPGSASGIYARTVPDRLRRLRQHQRRRDRAGPEAAGRAVHRDRAVPAAGAQQRHRAVHRRRRRRVRLALQRERASSSTTRRLDLPRQLRRQRARRPVRSSSAACAFPVGALGHRRRDPVSVRRRAICRRRGLRRDEDRSRRVQLPLHGQRQVLRRRDRGFWIAASG